LLETEFIIAFVFGETKRPRPRPTNIRLAITVSTLVSSPTPDSDQRPTAVRAMPIEATTLGSTLSAT